MSQTEIEPVAQATKIVSYDEAFGCVKTAVRKTALYFEDKKNTRGKVIMPCGSGKTLFSCFLAMRELKPQRTIITVPNLLLEEQSFRVFYSQMINEGYEFICIGSDEDIAQGLGEQIQVTTSLNEITSFLANNINKKIIMLATYQSIKVVCDSCQDIDFKFNLGIIDEAHRTVGGEEKMFSKILFNENIHIDNRLFMTATEKVYKGNKDEIIGMNNVKYYGETIYNYSLADAIEKDKILCDYEINEMYTTDDEVFEFIKSNSYLDYENIDLSDKEKQGLLCALIATIKGIKEKGCKKIVTYHSKVKNATIFKGLLEKIIENKMLDMGVFHVNGINQSTSDRRQNMEDFQSSLISILTNSKALVEGIDMPCIDGIVYADKKESTIEIVQSVGRALRKYEGKNKCHIIIPILTSSKEDISFNNADFSGLLSVLMQMSMQDERLLHEITSISEGKNNISINSEILQSNIRFDSRFREELLRFNKSIQLRIVNKLTEIIPYDESKKWICENLVPIGINNSINWYKYLSGEFTNAPQLPNGIPKHPQHIYKHKGWRGWKIFFDITFLSFKEARLDFRKNIMVQHNVKNVRDWKKYRKNLPKNIPRSPDVTYKGKGWKSWGNWFGRGFENKNGKYLSFKEARLDFIKNIMVQHNIKTVGDWMKYKKNLPKNIPRSPDVTYKYKGWKGWHYWFNSKITNPKITYLSYNETKEWVEINLLPLGINSVRKWKRYLKGNIKHAPDLPKNIPRTPDSVYKNKGWKGWNDLFGRDDEIQQNKFILNP